MAHGARAADLLRLGEAGLDLRERLFPGADRRERGDRQECPAAVPLDQADRDEPSPLRDAAVFERAGAHHHALDGRGREDVAQPDGHEADPEGVRARDAAALVPGEPPQDAPLEVGGTTLRDYLGADGAPGYFRQRLYVYEREGKPCRRCGTPVRAVTQGQRSTYYCPSCQK